MTCQDPPLPSVPLPMCLVYPFSFQGLLFLFFSSSSTCLGLCSHDPLKGPIELAGRGGNKWTSPQGCLMFSLYKELALPGETTYILPCCQLVNARPPIRMLHAMLRRCTQIYAKTHHEPCLRSPCVGHGCSEGLRFISGESGELGKRAEEDYWQLKLTPDTHTVSDFFARASTAKARRGV